jgi:hypothetical protein
MDRTLIALLAVCTLLAGVIALELQPSNSEEPPATVSVESPEPPPSRPELPRIDGLIATAKERPLFSATRRPVENTAPGNAADPDLSDVRLAGIIMEPERHMAIFAVSGAKPMVRLEGENVKEWRLESISPNEVSLSGPGGVRTLSPKADPHLVRQAPAILAAPGGGSGSAVGRVVPNAGAAQLPPAGRPPFPVGSTGQPASVPPAQPQAIMGPLPARAPNFPARPGRPSTSPRP